MTPGRGSHDETGVLKRRYERHPGANGLIAERYEQVASVGRAAHLRAHDGARQPVTDARPRAGVVDGDS